MLECLTIGMSRLRSVALGIVWFALATHAANPRVLPEGYTRRVWQTQDGLPENTVQAFAQTPDNYLWIGTSGGLVRFDGAGFVLYDRDNTPAMHDNSIFCLTVSTRRQPVGRYRRCGAAAIQRRHVPLLSGRARG